MTTNKIIVSEIDHGIKFIPDNEYWQKRCELAERIVATALDSDSINNHTNSKIIKDWQEIKDQAEYFSEPILIVEPLNDYND